MTCSASETATKSTLSKISITKSTSEAGSTHNEDHAKIRANGPDLRTPRSENVLVTGAASSNCIHEPSARQCRCEAAADSSSASPVAIC